MESLYIRVHTGNCFTNGYQVKWSAMETSTGVRECVYAFEEAAKVSPNVCVHMREWVGFASLHVYNKGASYSSTSDIQYLCFIMGSICIHAYIHDCYAGTISEYKAHLIVCRDPMDFDASVCVCVFVCALKRGTLHSEQVFSAAVGL